MQGFRFVDRLISEWESGLNTFSQNGEVLLGGFDDGELIAIGGLNKDPYLQEATVGRIRHLYVLTKWRRLGVGEALVTSLLGVARNSFSTLRLRTDTEEATCFYGKCGFKRVQDSTASHHWVAPQP
jgi:N-acetylglutamate synthase-like GNAT family acetyltransferase